MVEASIELFGRVQRTMLPTPSKSHYVYNLRDLRKVFLGIARGVGKQLNQDEDLIKLWQHECLRVFADRLVPEDQE